MGGGFGKLVFMYVEYSSKDLCCSERYSPVSGKFFGLDHSAHLWNRFE
jgi:hypothetical protein